DLLAGHDHLARVGGEEPGDHRDGGGLAGTVGTEKPVGLPRLDMETDTIHCHQVTETLSEAVDGQHFTHVITSLPGGSGYGRRPGYSRNYGPLRRVRRHASVSRGPWRGGRAHRSDPWSRWLGARLGRRGAGPHRARPGRGHRPAALRILAAHQDCRAARDDR